MNVYNYEKVLMSNEDKISTHYIDEDQESHSNQKEVSFGETLEFQVPIDKSKWSCWAKRWLKWPLLILFLSICLFFVYFRTLNAMENYISNIEQIQKQLNRRLGSKLFEEIDILKNNLDMSIRNNSKQFKAWLLLLRVGYQKLQDQGELFDTGSTVG